jgi:hypothetical protein
MESLPLLALRRRSHLLAQEEIAPQAQLIDDRQILVDGFDPDRPRLRRRGKAHVLSHEPQRAFGRRLVAGKNLEEGRFPGAIVADQTHDLARPYRQIDVENDLVAPVSVRD